MNIATSTHPPDHRTRTASPPTRRYATAAVVAIAGVAIAVIWIAAAIVPVMNQVADLPRTDIPGQVTIDIAEPGEHVIYYERATWFASVPMEPELAVEVAGPDGESLSVEPYQLAVQYRLPGQVGEVHATFVAEEAGEHTAAVEGDVPDDAGIAVGPSLVAQVVGGLVAPVALLLISLLIASVIAVRAARR